MDRGREGILVFLCCSLSTLILSENHPATATFSKPSVSQYRTAKYFNNLPRSSTMAYVNVQLVLLSYHWAYNIFTIVRVPLYEINAVKQKRSKTVIITNPMNTYCLANNPRSVINVISVFPAWQLYQRLGRRKVVSAITTLHSVIILLANQRYYYNLFYCITKTHTSHQHILFQGIHTTQGTWFSRWKVLGFTNSNCLIILTILVWLTSKPRLDRTSVWT